MHTHACDSFAHRECARVGLARILQVQTFCPHSHGLGIGLAYANLLPKLPCIHASIMPMGMAQLLQTPMQNFCPKQNWHRTCMCIRWHRTCKAMQRSCHTRMGVCKLFALITWHDYCIVTCQSFARFYRAPIHTRVYGQKNNKAKT